MTGGRFLLLTIGTAGDVYPFLGLGRELQRRGHDVLLASLGIYRTPAESAGLRFCAVEGVAGATGHPDFYHPTKGMEVVASHVLLPALAPVYALARRAADEGRIVVADPFCYGARVAEDEVGLPLMTCVVSPFLLRSVERMPVTPGLAPPRWAPATLKRAFFRLVARLWDRRLAPELNRFRHEHGLGPVRSIFYDWGLSPRAVLGLFPDWFAPRASDWPVQFRHGGFSVYDGYEASELPPELRESDEPLVVFAAGSAGVAAERFFAAAVEASRGQRWRAVLLGGQHRLGVRVPSNVSCYSYIPLRRLLPRASAVVFHGGLGTMSLAMAAGTPQVIAPFGHDQYDNAARASSLGVARVVHKLQDMGGAVKGALDDAALRERALALSPRAEPAAQLAAACGAVEHAVTYSI